MAGRLYNRLEGGCEPTYKPVIVTPSKRLLHAVANGSHELGHTVRVVVSIVVEIQPFP